MITTYFDSVKKDTIPALSFPSIYDNSQVVSLRDALADVLHNIVSYPDPKEGTDPYSLFLLTEMINELTKDIEGLAKEKGGEV